MAYIDGLLISQSSTEPLFRRVDPFACLGPYPIEADTEPASLASDPHTIIVRQNIDRETNGQPETHLRSSHSQRSKFILAVDFGTTYSTVSYAKVDHGIDAASLEVADIRCIDNYENAVGGRDARANSRADTVPTEILYLGSAISLDASDSDSVSDSSTLRDTTPKDNGNHKQISTPGRKRGKKRSARSSKSMTQSTWTRPVGVSLKWGFSVQETQKYPEALQLYQESEIVKLIKLTLNDETKDQAKKRRELAQQIRRLQSSHFVENRDHVLQDYLTRLLHHARCRLRKEAGLQDHSEFEFVLCVPVSWSESACRIMHDAMVKAIQNCRLVEDLAQDAFVDLFIVSEPEAAAQFVLASLGEKGRLCKDEVFVLLDAGGGTVDITIYEVTSDGTGPLRLKGEMVPPDGALCGSSLISERYAAKLKVKLQAESLLDGADLDARVTALTYDWDMNYKPYIDIDNGDWQRRQIFVNGSKIQWKREEIRALFEPSLKGVTDLLEKQLQLAAAKGLNVSKLIVVGGFGESPSLRGRIEKVIAAQRNIMGRKVVTLWPREFPTSAVARGAVLRALNKRDGPSRISRSSFGFLQHEQYKVFPEHEEAGVVPTRDRVDHYPSVKDTINWVIQAGTKLPTRFETEPIVSWHAFSPDETKLICVEKLYSSPRKHRSHFQNHHPENKGASVLGHIEIDMSEFRHKFPFEPKATAGPRTKVSNRNNRVVKFDLVIVVEGRQLKYEARWPSGALSADEVRVRKRGYVSLAPSFVPGTE